MCHKSLIVVAATSGTLICQSQPASCVGGQQRMNRELAAHLTPFTSMGVTETGKQSFGPTNGSLKCLMWLIYLC